MSPESGRSSRLRWRVAIVVGIAALAVAPSAAKKEDKKTPSQTVKSWVEGPARYLMSNDEYERIKKLGSVPELARFITDFWARRDPTRGTFENEYRREYWGRVLEANKRFRDSTTPGWKTDRGRVFVMLGEPNYIESDEHPSVPLGPNRGTGQSRQSPEELSGNRGLERWHYNRKRSRGASPEFMVAFVRDASLDWKLSTDPDLLTPSFPGIATDAANDRSFGGIDESTAARVTPRETATTDSQPGAPGVVVAPAIGQEIEPLAQFDATIFLNYDLGLEISVPQSSELMIATVSAEGFLSAFTATPRFEFFRAQDGSTFVNVGALLRPSELYGDRKEGKSGLRLYASLTGTRDPSISRYVTNEKNPLTYDLATAPPPGSFLDLWTGLALPPGKYLATIAVEDSLTGSLGRGSTSIEVPEFPEGRLALSSLVLASALSEATGRLGITARASSVFSKEEEFGVYYEVYGADTGSGTLRFETAYQFSRETKTGPEPIGKPIVFPDRNQAAQAWSFPLSKWPTGAYRLEVTVTRADGTKVSAQTPFEVTE